MSDIPEAAQRAAEAAYTEKLVELRLAEGGGFKVASQQRRAIAFALEAAAPHMLREAYSLGWRNGTGNPTPIDANTGELLPGGAEPDYHPYRPTP